MPRMTASREEIKGLPPMPEGMVTFRLDGFKPKLSNKKDSINLNPIMVITNNDKYNDRKLFENLNTKAKWIWKDFCHSLGVPIEEDSAGDFTFPGDFPGTEGSDPSTWGPYVGPLLGQMGQVYIIQADDGNGGITNKVKFYVCKMAPCGEKHSQNLVRS